MGDKNINSALISTPTFRIGEPGIQGLASVTAVVIVSRQTSLAAAHHPHPVGLDVAGLLHRLEHDDHVGLRQGDVDGLSHLQLPGVGPVGQVVAVGHSGGAEREMLEHQISNINFKGLT